MRNYAKMNPVFWIDEKSNLMKNLCIEAHFMASYLMTNTHSNMIGIYHLPINYISFDLGIPIDGASMGHRRGIDGASVALKELCNISFCSYDHSLHYIWVHEMASCQVGDELKEGDKRVVTVRELYSKLPNLSFLKDFYDKYHKKLHLDISRENQKIKQNTDAPSMPHRCPIDAPSMQVEEEGEVKEEVIVKVKEEVKELKTLVEQTRPRDPKPQEIFSHWQKVMNHPRAILDDRRKKLINEMLKLGYTADELCEAITGCSYTPHNMGDNDRNTRFDSIEVIFRTAGQIDRFIANARTPPKKLTKAEKNTKENINGIQKWLSRSQNEDAQNEKK